MVDVAEKTMSYVQLMACADPRVDEAKLPAHIAEVALVVWNRPMAAIVRVVVARLLETNVARKRTVCPLA